LRTPRSSSGSDAGRLVREHLEREQRADDRVTVAPLVLAAARPFAPVLARRLEQLLGVGRPPVERLVRAEVLERERQALAGAHREVRLQARVVPVGLEGHRAVERERVGPRGERGVVAFALDPRQELAVGEAHAEVAAHLHLAFDADDDANDVVVRAGRHEVDDLDAPAVAADLGLEDDRLRLVMLIDAAHPRRGTQRPVAVLVAAQELSEAGIGVDARHAHPVDRAGA
jgi:hypothetical protein